MLRETVTNPEFWINTVVPLVAFVALAVKLLLLMLTFAAEEVLIIPVNVPDVAVVYVQPVTELKFMLTVLPAAVDPIPLSIPSIADVVPPPLILTVLLLIFALALVPVCAKIPLKVLG